MSSRLEALSPSVSVAPSAFDSSASRLQEKLSRNFGPLFMAALADKKTVEILLNPDGTLWQERLGEALRPIGTMSHSSALAAMNTVASMLGKTLTYESPRLEGELPIDGSRFAGLISPAVLAPTFAIRKKASSVFTLDHYVDAAILSQTHCHVIKQAVKDHRNIVVIGGTGTGKTTLTNGIIHEMVQANPLERFLVIEDTGEIQCAAKNHVALHTSSTVTMTDLLRTSLRLRPDRIIVGECRGAEALDLLDAWNTGHEGGVATIHANHPAAGLTRLRSLISRNPASPREIEPLIAEAVHFVVHIAKISNHRRQVLEVLEVKGFGDHGYITCKH